MLRVLAWTIVGGIAGAVAGLMIGFVSGSVAGIAIAGIFGFDGFGAMAIAFWMTIIGIGVGGGYGAWDFFERARRSG